MTLKKKPVKLLLTGFVAFSTLLAGFIGMNENNPIISETTASWQSQESIETILTSKFYLWDTVEQVHSCDGPMGSIMYADGKFLTNGGCGIIGSSNGTDWDLVYDYPRKGSTGSIYADGLFVFGGLNNILTSEDGINWNETGDLSSLTIGTGEFRGHSYNPETGRWVSVTRNGQFFISDNRWETWSGPYVGDMINAFDVTYADGRYVAAGGAGEMAWSTNGIDWNTVDSPSNNNVLHVTHDGDRFVAAGDGNVIMVSENGEVWSQIPTGQDLGNFISIHYDEESGHYAAVTSRGEIATSANLNHWWVSGRINGIHLRDTVIVGDSVYAIGYGGDRSSRVYKVTESN